MTIIKDILDKIDIIKKEIIDCDNLTEMYRVKKITLEAELRNFEMMRVYD
jgi:hypothetical protein